MGGMVDTPHSEFVVLRAVLDDRAQRFWAATEARTVGRGGIAWMVEVTEMSRGAVCAGLEELDSDAVFEPSGEVPSGRWHCSGGRHKRMMDLEPELTAARERQLEPMTHSDPGNPLRWTRNHAAGLADQLAADSHPVSERTVNQLLPAGLF